MKKIQIDQNSYQPIYLQIRSHLRELVVNHRDFDKPFYSENELSKMFSVSRLTIRRALQELLDRGQLYRVKGLGTFKNSRIEGELVYSKGYISQWRLQGKEVVAKVFNIQRQPAKPRIANNLGVEENTEVITLERIRYADGEPIVVDDIFLPHLALMESDILLLEDITVQSLLENTLQKVPAMALIEVNAVEATSREQKYLNLKSKMPLLRRDITFLEETGEALSYGESFHHPDMFRYRFRIPVSMENP